VSCCEKGTDGKLLWRATRFRRYAGEEESISELTEHGKMLLEKGLHGQEQTFQSRVLSNIPWKEGWLTTYLFLARGLKK
jgi:hypothetical protein